VTVKKVQTELLDEDTVLLQYALDEDRSYVWAVEPGALHVWELPARAVIEKLAQDAYELVINRSSGAAPTALKALSDAVIRPALSVLRNKRLLIVADGPLQRIPFSALPSPGSSQPMLVAHEIVMLPSASALAAIRRDASGRTPAPKLLALLADPVFDLSDPRVPQAETMRARRSEETTRRLEHSLEGTPAVAEKPLHIPRLPYTAQEAEQILASAPGKSFLKLDGFKANKTMALSGVLSDYRYLHFATHGYLNTEHPGLSAMVLAQIGDQGYAEDGFLRASDIYNMKLSADLVVLSACQTGLGKDVRGEGTMGLTRAFLYAGAPRVVVSLWSVNDLATAKLMAGFYRRMLRERLRPSEALRQAQLEMRKQNRWSSPYYWAAFVQQGEWR
jgi:CHAT domain-containing protein